MKLKVAKNTKIVSPKDIAEILKGFLSIADDVEKDREHLWTIGLNVRNVVVYAELVSMGTSTECLISPKEIYRRAVIGNVNGIILAHNHPSGDVNPSSEDLQVTKKIKEVGETIGINLIDHVIINDKGDYFSLKANNLIIKEGK